MSIVLKNNAKSTLSAAISSLDTTIPITDTSSFPSLGTDEYFYLTIESTAGAYEIVKVTQTNASSFAAVRGQEDTIAIPFSAGARVELRVTVKSMEDFLLTGNNIDNEAYGASWNGDTDDAPSRNAVYDKIEALDAETAKLTDANVFTNVQTMEDAHIRRSGSGAATRLVFENEDGLHRWILQMDADTESGTDVGSNLDLYSYYNLGTVKELVLDVTRSTGVVDFKKNPTVNGSAVVKASDIGTSVQAYDADLATWATLTPSANFQTLVPQTFAQMRASLDLEPNTDFYAPGGTDVAIADGGTGGSTAKAAAANLSVPYVIADSAVAVPHTGTTSETILATIPIAAGDIGANGSIEVDALFSYTNSANAKTLRVRLGGIGGAVFDTASPTTTAAMRRLIKISNRNSASSQVSGSSGATGGTGTISAPTTGTINTANAQDLVITGTLANSGETITLESYRVIINKRA